jgi:hypothetical protein
MKRLSLVLLVLMLGTLGLPAQSLADAARQAQAAKKATPPVHVYTNDDIAPVATETPTETADAKAADAKIDSGKDTAKDTAKDKKDSKESAAANSEALKRKITDLQKSISDQEKDVSIMEREHQIRVAEYYADAGTQLRTSGKWFEDEKQYQSDLDTKKKGIADSKAALDDLNEQARKAGAAGK